VHLVAAELHPTTRTGTSKERKGDGQDPVSEARARLSNAITHANNRNQRANLAIGGYCQACSNVGDSPRNSDKIDGPPKTWSAMLTSSLLA